jgi:hypothetical protein
MEEVIGDEIINSKLFEDIPTSPSMKAEMTVETLEESTPLTIDADGDGKKTHHSREKKVMKSRPLSPQ